MFYGQFFFYCTFSGALVVSAVLCCDFVICEINGRCGVIDEIRYIYIMVIDVFYEFYRQTDTHTSADAVD